MNPIITLLSVLMLVAFAQGSQSSLRHQIDIATATTSLQTCKDLGSTWNSITGKVDSVKGTWQGDQCNTKCTAQKGIVCGTILKDCCAMECQGSYFYKYCKFDLKLSRAMMQCGV